MAHGFDPRIETKAELPALTLLLQKDWKNKALKVETPLSFPDSRFVLSEFRLYIHGFKIKVIQTCYISHKRVCNSIKYQFE